MISVAGGYVPTAGQIIPSRSTVWWDPTEFQWPTGLAFGALQFAAQKIFVGSILRVGGGSGTDAASFAGQLNGQIAVFNASNQMVGWVGQQQPTQGNGAATAGAWFKALWVGGSDPTNAPLWIDSQGIIEVGGIAAAHGAAYPYISVRDNTGLECGRIGAMISSASDSTGNVGGAPPTITSGAWFTQLAVGGSNLTNWNVLITPDLTNPLGSNFQMRNINLLSIDYPAHSGTPSNNEYKIEFGNSVWMTAGLTGWQFPGIRIYEIDGHQNVSAGQASGMALLSRGIVIRGSFNQGYPPLVSLVQWNGDQTGSDLPVQFFGQLTMANPLTPSFQGVVIASGSSVSGQVVGSAYMRLGDVNNNIVIAADVTGCTAVAFSTVSHGQVIDSAGNWHGQPIAGSQTPWASNIAGAGFSLSNVGSLQVNGATTTGSLAIGFDRGWHQRSGHCHGVSILCRRHASHQHHRPVRASGEHNPGHFLRLSQHQQRRDRLRPYRDEAAQRRSGSGSLSVHRYRGRGHLRPRTESGTATACSLTPMFSGTHSASMESLLDGLRQRLPKEDRAQRREQPTPLPRQMEKPSPSVVESSSRSLKRRLMEKTYQLDQRESAMLQSLDQERTQALAAVGALSLDMETARKNLDAAAEKQRAFLRQVVMTRGIDRYENARMQNGSLVVALPDAPAPTSDRLDRRRTSKGERPGKRTSRKGVSQCQGGCPVITSPRRISSTAPT